MSRKIALTLALSALLAFPAGALADHDTQYQWGEKESPTLNPAMKNVKEPPFVAGACTDVARRAMPSPAGHDHLKMGAHDFKCRMQKVFFDPLDEILAARPEVVLGEMDIKGNLMAIAVAYPESGFLLYDISNPAQPTFLSWYRGEECEQVVLDSDCGAYVDISPSLDRVYISLQQVSVLPNPSATMRPPGAYPGIEVVDITVPSLPLLRHAQPVVSVGGVHTTKSFVVPEQGGAGPREPGEYTVSVANSVGLVLHQVLPTGTLRPVEVMQVGETHDTFIQDDPILGRTLLYAAGGFTTGFYVWDITAPSEPVLLAEWDPTPECGADWYAHTIDVAVRDGKRIVTMPNELIDFFGEVGDDEYCGRFQGNGDYAGPVWFVDATDLSKLGPAEVGEQPENPELKAASERALSAVWSNPAKRAGGELTFSPHNQQIVGDKIYLSQYHGGIVVLDAKEALEGKNVRPREIGLYVPADGEGRPIPPDAGGIYADYHFVTGFIDYHPLIWDTMYANGHVFIPDMTGGLTVVREDDAPPAVIGPGHNPPACADRRAPTSRLTSVRISRSGIRLAGRSRDHGCSRRVSRVAVSLARLAGNKCSFLSSFKRFERARSCRKPIFLTAKGSSKWSYSVRAKGLRRGRYLVQVHATDAAGNRERARGKAVRRVRVRR